MPVAELAEGFRFLPRKIRLGKSRNPIDTSVSEGLIAGHQRLSLGNYLTQDYRRVGQLLTNLPKTDIIVNIIEWLVLTNSGLYDIQGG